LDTPKLNCWTCWWMYWRKASLDHLLINMMVNTGIPDKYIAIVAPTCLPCSYPRTSSPMKWTTVQRWSSSIFQVTCLSLPLTSL
jgi:hypothetical protein